MAFLIHRDLKWVVDILRKNKHVSPDDARDDKMIIKDLLLNGVLTRRHLMRLRDFGDKAWLELIHVLGLEESVREATGQEDVQPLRRPDSLDE